MKELMLLIPLGSALLLTGCAGTETEFECNATTSDTCMTMEQANEKAKAREESASAKPVAAGLPRLAEGHFSTSSSYPLPPQPALSATGTVTPAVPASTTAGMLSAPARQPLVTRPGTTGSSVTPVNQITFRSPVTLPGDYPRPLRKGEQTASLWVAPYIDSDDVYHQPTTVLFVVTPSEWGQPRIH
ncbi:type IV conjugative transfer system lipoprotein TraV [Klebsiella oxytoca]|uniref:type IV conjugative transfer system lipoprotein TraV n=1 Tax=Klebsiella oxytoca TaxID=571 RepID=UPI00190EAFFF|nr:type IV conjugative transfer system lipoprotein TraV [Klebsiella oxytoca]